MAPRGSRLLDGLSVEAILAVNDNKDGRGSKAATRSAASGRTYSALSNDQKYHPSDDYLRPCHARKRRQMTLAKNVIDDSASDSSHTLSGIECYSDPDDDCENMSHSKSPARDKDAESKSDRIRSSEQSHDTQFSTTFYAAQDPEVHSGDTGGDDSNDGRTSTTAEVQSMQDDDNVALPFETFGSGNAGEEEQTTESASQYSVGLPRSIHSVIEPDVVGLPDPQKVGPGHRRAGDKQQLSTVGDKPPPKTPSKPPTVSDSRDRREGRYEARRVSFNISTLPHSPSPSLQKRIRDMPSARDQPKRNERDGLIQTGNPATFTQSVSGFHRALRVQDGEEERQGPDFERQIQEIAGHALSTLARERQNLDFKRDIQEIACRVCHSWRR